MNIFGLGTQEILLIVFLLLLFFGKDRLPGLAQSIGETFRELKNSLHSTKDKTSGDNGMNRTEKNDDEKK